MNPPSEPVIRMAARGDGVTAGGRFVPGAVPGDRVAPDGTIEAGPGHVEPACRHFGHCGGCQLQHAADPLLSAFARDRILEPLRAVGIVPAEILPTALSPPQSRRRAAMRATRRQGMVRLGFNAAGTHDLVDIAECPVLSPGLMALVGPLRALLSRHLAERAAVSVTMAETDHGVDLLLGNLRAAELPEIAALVAFAAAARLARLSVDGPDGPETVVAEAPPTVTMGGVSVTLPPGAFLQATREGEAALVAAVRSCADGAGRVADLFSGLGTFALPLSEKARVIAADAAGPAIRALERAARMAGRPVVVAHRDLFRRPFAAAELSGFDAVVLDPPRAGAAAQAAELARASVPVVAAVSCNPATFARDAKALTDGGYALRRLWPVAQFRWSTHVELVAEFRRD